MTELEERLGAEDATEVRAAVLSRLVHLDDAVGVMVRRGLTQEEFRRAQAVRGAVAAARNFLAMRR